MKNIETNDLLTLENGNKYIVLDSLDYENNFYAFTDSVSPDENEALGIYKVLCISNNGAYVVTDDNLLNRILPIFSSNIQQLLVKNGLLG